MRIVQQQAPGQLPDIERILDFFAQSGNHGLQIQHRDGVAVVGGATQCLQDQLQAIGIPVAADLTLVQLQLVQYRLHAIVAHALAGHSLQHAQYQLLECFDVVRLGALHPAGEDHFAHAVLETAQGRGCLAQFRGLKRLLQGRSAVVEQHTGKQLRLKQLLQVGALSQQPADDDMGFPVCAAVLVIGITAGHPQWRRQALFRRYLDALIESLELSQGARLEHRLVFGRGNVTKGHENRVTGVVVAAVEVPELIVTQVRNVLGVAAAVVVIGGGGENVLAQGIP